MPRDMKETTPADDPKAMENAMSDESHKAKTIAALDNVEAATVGHGFFFWFIVSFLADAVSAVLGVTLWSAIGMGTEVMVSLAKMATLAYPIGFLAFLVIVFLYLLDFFCPPHLGTQRLALGPPGSCATVIGRAVFSFALVLMVVCVCFMIKDYPHIPPLLTAFIGPFLVGLCRKSLAPEDKKKDQASEEKSTAAKKILRTSILKQAEEKESFVSAIRTTAVPRMSLQGDTLDSAERYLATTDLMHFDHSALHKVDPEKIRNKLRMRRGKSQDARRFYSAAALALMSVSVIIGVYWIHWWVGQNNRWNPTTRDRFEDDGINAENFDEAGVNYNDFEEAEEAALKRKKIMYVIWASPIITCAAHGLFGIMMILRWKMHDTYVKTDQFEMAIQKALAKVANQVYEEGYDALEEAKNLNAQITSQVRIFVSVFVGLMACVWIASQVTCADVEAARIVKNFVGFFMIALVLFLTQSFQNWWREMGSLVQTSPLYKSLLGIMRSDWVKACLVWVVSPFWPFILFLSAMNQKVRQCRGVQDPNDWRIDQKMKIDVKPRSDSPEAPAVGDEVPASAQQAPGCLTARIAGTVSRMKTWDWTMVWNKVHWLGILFFLLNVGSAKGLNIFLAWLNFLLKDLHLSILVVIFYLVGIGCFLLPPIPGPPVYLFGGLMFASNPALGPLNGTLLCCFISWLLKLNACAMQQKCIGEQLGNSKWVLSTCGVNKPMMKAIEMVLREPGISVGKCSILCGGPDWPTSVTCGLLRIPLWQAIIGTTPIIGFVVPCVCTGAFYVQEGDIWVTLASLMLTTSAAASMALLAAATFAVQGKMDLYRDHLERPLEKHIYLDWLDHVSTECSIVAKAQLGWNDFPCWVRVWQRIGAGMMLMGCHIFVWFDEACFQEFTIQSDINTLDWDFVKKPFGAAGLIFFFASCLSFIFFKKYCGTRSKGPVKELKEKMALEEEAWKADRKRQADEAEEELQATPERLPPEFRRQPAT